MDLDLEEFDPGDPDLDLASGEPERDRTSGDPDLTDELDLDLDRDLLEEGDTDLRVFSFLDEALDR